MLLKFPYLKKIKKNIFFTFLPNDGLGEEDGDGELDLLGDKISKRKIKCVFILFLTTFK